MTKIDTHNSSSFGMVNVSELNIDPEAQRKFSPGWVKARIQLFDVDLLGYIVVNKRTNGKHYIVDGQHRVELMRAVGWGDQKIHAEFFTGLNQAGEAALFRKRNDRKSIRRFDDFRIAVTEGDLAAVAINSIVQQHGLTVSDQLVDGHICAVDALERVYKGGGIASPKEGPQALSKSLGVTVQAWGKQASGVNGKVIQALGSLFLRYDGKINEADLAKKLAPFPGGPSGLLGKGKTIRELRGKQLHHCIASIIVDTYNKGRKGATKLEEWDA